MSEKHSFFETKNPPLRRVAEKATKKKIKKKKPATVWEAVNEPVIEITEAHAKNLFLATALIIAAAWLTPYWGSGSVIAQESYEGTIFEQVAAAGKSSGMVAGASTESYAVLEGPDWYYTLEAMPVSVATSFSDAAHEVLDVSEPVGEMIEFYEPGVSAVWNEWLNLMRDPGTPEF